MAGMAWRDIRVGDEVYSMSHLHAQEHVVDVNGVAVTIELSFGFHVFTDEKQKGHLIRFKNEARYFCVERYEGSKTVTPRILAAIESGDYITAFISKVQGQRYYHLSLHDDFILMEIRKPADRPDTLRIHVVTAYTLDDWGRPTKGRNLKFKYVLEQRLQGKKIV